MRSRHPLIRRARRGSRPRDSGRELVLPADSSRASYPVLAHAGVPELDLGFRVARGQSGG